MIGWLLACTSTPDAVAPDAGEPSPVSVGPLEATAPPTAQLVTYREMWADLLAVRHSADGGGRLWLEGGPRTVVAGSTERFELGFEVGPLGIAEGGALHFLPSPFWGWSPPQSEVEAAPGFTEVQLDVPGVRLEPRSAGGQLTWTVRGGSLPAGAVVRWQYGVGEAGARVDRFAERDAALWAAVDGDGDGVRQVVAQPAVVTVEPGEVVGLYATLPSTAEPGVPIQLTVAALDTVGNAGRGLSGPVALRLPETVTGPASLTLSDAGTAVAELVVNAPGVVHIELEGPDGLVGRSNPVVCRAGIEPILWGDLQIHSGLSDGTGVPADLYRYARDVAGLDVAALTDHDHWGMRFLDQTSAWQQQLVTATDAAHTPGQFVALHGYEWTNWVSGHRHVLGFDAEPLPIRSSLDPNYDTPGELWASLRGQAALTVAHHSAGGPVAIDWSIRPDPVLEPVTEIASVHGQSESPDSPGIIADAVPGNFVIDQLRAGVRLGFVGSTDGHDGHPGLSHLAGGRGGLVALVGAQHTRASILQTLRSRNTYATNGVRTLLRVSVGGQPMGSSLAASSEPVPLEVRVVGTAPIDHVEVVQREGVTASVAGDGGRLLHHAWSIEGLRNGDFVYVRIHQVDGGMAWSSPVFVGGD